MEFIPYCPTFILIAEEKLMFGNPSLVTRIAIGKAVGLAFGLIGFIFLPYFWPEASLLLRVGILFWD